MIRFNREGRFNVPYGHKHKRFTKAYITKIANQVRYIESCLLLYDWEFVCQPFEKTIAMADTDLFIYCDPPYIGRHNDYYDTWDELCEEKLCGLLLEAGCKFMLSTWDYNEYRRNEYISKLWNFCRKITHEHFYLSAQEDSRFFKREMNCAYLTFLCHTSFCSSIPNILGGTLRNIRAER